MKLIVAVFLLLSTAFSPSPGTTEHSSPLAGYSSDWNAPRFLKCNTAASTAYLSDKEKELIYIFNMLRMDPQLFCSTVVKQYPEKSGDIELVDVDEYKSLLEIMARLEPLPMLYPEKRLTESAKCHAISSGQKAYVGHERQTNACDKKMYFEGECCDYGHSNPLDILMALLIDEGIPDLGHRWICLSDFTKIGVSIQPHREYDTNAVLDFMY